MKRKEEHFRNLYNQFPCFVADKKGRKITMDREIFWKKKKKNINHMAGVTSYQTLGLVRFCLLFLNFYI